jgi:hypothetical protein
MPDKPPAGPADHAQDFARRYADELEIATGEVMLQLGLSNDEMGLRDPSRRLEHHTFFPSERTCGGVSPLGQINLDSGVMNPQVMDDIYGEACGKIWRKTRLRDRLMAVIAHEKAEKEYGGDHELALIAAAETKLPISHAARVLLRAMEAGYKGH